MIMAGGGAPCPEGNLKSAPTCLLGRLLPPGCQGRLLASAVASQTQEHTIEPHSTVSGPEPCAPEPSRHASVPSATSERARVALAPLAGNCAALPSEEAEDDVGVLNRRQVVAGASVGLAATMAGGIVSVPADAAPEHAPAEPITPELLTSYTRQAKRKAEAMQALVGRAAGRPVTQGCTDR